MKGVLYKVTNNINDKVYIGKTYQNLNARILQHKSEAKRSNNRKFYRAINKYGFENFNFEVISELEEGTLELEEIKLIEYYNSYFNGYNSTLGGDGKRYLDICEIDIINSYKVLNSIADVAYKYKISVESVRAILISNNIKLLSSAEVLRLRGERIRIVDINEEFVNAQECAQFLIDSDIVNITSIEHIVRSIRRVAEGSRRTYKKLQFEYIK